MEKFQSPSGKFYTRQLFWEESIELSSEVRVIDPVFTLYKDKPGLINFGKAYVESEDPTGYKVAEELLGGYRLWTVLMQSKWFQAAKKLWDEELDARLASKGFEKIKDLAKNGLPAQQLAAAKYLANGEHRKDHKATKGRPTKAQIEEKAKEEADLQSRYVEDYKRIRLVKN
jgi:hypothetical protein